MAVARVLSSQKPGERESCRSVSTLYRRFSTSKKPPQDNYTVPHNFNLFLCHSNKNKGIALGLLKLVTKIKTYRKNDKCQGFTVTICVTSSISPSTLDAQSSYKLTR